MVRVSWKWEISNASAEKLKLDIAIKNNVIKACVFNFFILSYMTFKLALDMSLKFVTEKLPKSILEKGNLMGNEYAWPLELIPEVIEAGRKANFVNVGGQLQFRIPQGVVGGPATCELYWIQVDTLKSITSKMNWVERVEITAKVAIKEFQTLLNTRNLVTEGRKEFANYVGLLNEKEAHKYMYFVWYVAEDRDKD